MTHAGSIATAGGPMRADRVSAPHEAPLTDQVDRVVAACLDLATAFRSGATLYILGTGPASADAQHVTVEFVHPVIVGKPSLPAVSLVADVGALSGALASGEDYEIFSRELDVLARPGDVLLAMSGGRPDRATVAALAAAGRLGLTSIALIGSETEVQADHVICCTGADGRAEKEARVTAYHLLWEITHVALEQQSGPGPAMASCQDTVCVTCADEALPATIVELCGDGLAVVEISGERQQISIALVDADPGATVLVHAGEAIALVDDAGFEAGVPTGTMPGSADDPMAALYPFLSGEAQPPVDRAADLRASTLRKIEEAADLRARCITDNEQALRECAAVIAARVRAGGRLLTFGNGGSSTDAATLAGQCLSPGNGHRPIPALALPMDVATVTALANDVSFSVVFSRQITSLGRPEDIAVALSTSGSSDNLLRGLETARSRGLLTVAFAGGNGGRMAVERAADYLFIIPSPSVHRIQEAQTTLYDLLWQFTREALEREETSRH